MSPSERVHTRIFSLEVDYWEFRKEAPRHINIRVLSRITRENELASQTELANSGVILEEEEESLLNT